MPVLGISYTSTLDHYLYQIEKFDCGLVSFIDFDYQNELENKLEEVINSKRWDNFFSSFSWLNFITLCIDFEHEIEKSVFWPGKEKERKTFFHRFCFVRCTCSKIGRKSHLMNCRELEIDCKISFSHSICRFKANSLKLRNLISDQPIGNSVERAAWWIDYVIRNGGTVSLPEEKSPNRHQLSF